MPTPLPEKLPQAASWPARSADSPLGRGHGLARAVALGALALVALLVMSAWAIPPLLDWGRFRTAIEAIAGAELGRKVKIGGDVALRLLPEAVLTATDVTLPDRGDGMSARVGSLRLEVALGSLLAGHLVVRDLVLGSPVLTLPWPLPAGIVNPVRPHLPLSFAAHVENGTLRIGQTEVAGITAAVHGGPAPALLQETLTPESGPVAAFGAEGFAAFDGQRWRFTTALGAPDADGISAVDLALQGLDAVHDTGGAIQGTLSDGVIQGRLRAGGPDLSLLMHASPLAWHAEAPFVASGEKIVTNALALSLGGAPANATVALRLAAPSQLDATLHAASLDLDGWARVLDGKLTGFSPTTIPMRVSVSADSASLLGGTLGGLSGILVFDAHQASIDHGQAFLPGNARLDFSGHITLGAGGVLSLEGPADLDAPDLHATLAWLRPLAPKLIAATPKAVLQRAVLKGTAKLTPGQVSVAGLAGQLDGVPVAGSFDLNFSAAPQFSAEVTFQHLAIDAWLADSVAHPGMSLAAFVAPFTGVDTIVHVHAPVAEFHGTALKDFALDASTGASGLKIDHASALLPNGKLSGSGAIGPDGTLAGVQLTASSPDAAQLPGQLPPQWQLAPGVWQGQADLMLTADGPPNAVALQLRADLGDLTFEAESRRDTLAGTAQTTLTLRYPGAPSLLAALGWPGTENFLDNGSLALLAHVATSPGTATIEDFSLQAAALSLSGHGAVDLSGPEPGVTGEVRAERLVLPELGALRELRLPTAWSPKLLHAQLKLDAAEIELCLQPVAQAFSAVLTAGGGEVAIDHITAQLAGGRLRAQAAIDFTQQEPLAALQADLTGATISAPLMGMAIDADGGRVDAAIDLQASGGNEAAFLGSLSGEAHAALRDLSLSGFDLAQVKTLLTSRPRGYRAAVQAALSAGRTSGLSGTASAIFDHGRASLTDVNLVSPDGTITASGTVDMPTATVTAGFGIAASLPDAPHLSIKLAGIGRDAKATPDLEKLGAPARKAKSSVSHRARQTRPQP